MPAADITVVAHFEELAPVDIVTVSLSASGSGQVKAGDSAQGATSVAEIEKGGTITIKAIANSGYAFQKWSDNDTNANRTMTNVQNDLSLTAIFVEAGDTVTLSYQNGEGLGLKIDGQQVAAAGESGSVQLTKGSHTFEANEIDYGIEFSKWSDNNTDNPRTMDIQSDTTIRSISRES